MFTLSWPTSLADVKCERPSIYNLLLLKKRKKSTRALLKRVDSAQTVTRKSKCTQPQSPTDLFPDSYLEVYRSHICSPMCSIISYLVGIEQRFVLGALPFTYVLAHVLHNFLFSRYTVEVYKLGDLCKSRYKIRWGQRGGCVGDLGRQCLTSTLYFLWANNHQ